MIKMSGFIEQQRKAIKEMVAEGPDSNEDGTISAEELHKHFDTNGDGKVDMVDYAAHVLFHIENPQFLRKHMAAAQDRMVNSSIAEKIGKFVERGRVVGPSTYTVNN